ncbi:hypothetical protein [Oceaniovalibus sp. ACAM 378]|uniref:hypothetical protein n=1 Tax=Oceaniovalibus sp. ACAM 378 TaxID=2599923 RepID=UPI0011D34AEC|nr:hypothetical protein [Oceaniovalibus sp. ACAM 378]TYB85043.1 hypothetical protein FQ320_20160 [Oceaniovalibus sp. ACAM 378]
MAADKPAASNSIALSLGMGEVHVWLINLDAPALPEVAMKSMHSPEKTARCTAFALAQFRSRYLAGHGQRRVILSTYAACPARALVFEVSSAASLDCFAVSVDPDALPILTFEPGCAKSSTADYSSCRSPEAFAPRLPHPRRLTLSDSFTCRPKEAMIMIGTDRAGRGRIMQAPA